MDTSAESLDPHRQNVHGLPIHPAVHQLLMQQHQQQQQQHQFNPYTLVNLQQSLPNTGDPSALLQQPFSQDLGPAPQAPVLQADGLYYPNNSLPQLQTADQISSFVSHPGHVAQHASHVSHNQNVVLQHPPSTHPPPQVIERQADVKLSEGNNIDPSGVDTFRLKFESPMKLIEDPPELQRWRERLFHVDEPIFLTEDEFQTYFPHIDNVYSHRSTQTYKLKPFVSHYWDCRLKGRPPGTAKSTDPSKKKRKRVARERDLCDVKIKITEYKRGTLPQEMQTQPPAGQQDPGFGTVDNTTAGNVIPSSVMGWPPPQESQLQKWFSIQRVNGNGGNGKADGIPGPHKHSLEESDRVKKNSVIRLLISKNEKSRKSTQVS